jgi:hypothetical protein
LHLPSHQICFYPFRSAHRRGHFKPKGETSEETSVFGCRIVFAGLCADYFKRLTETVTDPAGAAVPGAAVTVLNAVTV